MAKYLALPNHLAVPGGQHHIKLTAAERRRYPMRPCECPCGQCSSGLLGACRRTGVCSYCYYGDHGAWADIEDSRKGR